MEQWYTHPGDSCSSFYYYDRSRRELVRIRLELNRAPFGVDLGQTFAVYQHPRYVGFSKLKYNYTVLDKFRLLEDGTMLDHKGRQLHAYPKQDRYVYDFTSKDGVRPDNKVHVGNQVVRERFATLPGDIKEHHLIRLAKICLREKNKIVLTDPSVNEGALADKIKEVIMTAHGGTEEDMSEEVSTGTDARDTTTSHRRGCRCCRCTII
jgi:hypothetical protein